MTHLLSRDRFATLVVAVVSLAASASAQPGPDARASARDAIAAFYTHFAAPDPAPFAGLWAPDARDRSDGLLAHRRLHVLARSVGLRDLDIGDLVVGDGVAHANVRYVLTGAPARDGDPLPAIGPKRRVIESHLRDGRWLVVRERASEAAIAEAIAAAEPARRLPLAREPGIDARALVLALADRALDVRERDRATAASLLDVARAVADDSHDPDARARVLDVQSIMAADARDLPRALALSDEALGIQGISPDVQATIILNRSNLHGRTGQAELVREWLARGLALREEAGLGALSSDITGNLAIEAYQRASYGDASRWANQAIALAEHLGNLGDLTRNVNNLGVIEHERGNYRAALAAYQRSLDLATANRDEVGRSNALNNMGLVHWLQDRLDIARDYFTRALALREAAGARALVAGTLQNLGLVERKQGAYEKALEYYARSLAIREEIGDQAGLALVHNSFGLVHDAQGRFDEALASYAKSLAISEAQKNRARMVQALANIAITQRKRGAYDESAVAAERTIAITREIGNREQLHSALTTLGEVLTLQGKFERARQALDEAIAVVESMRDDAGASAQEQQGFFESRTGAYSALVALHVARGDALSGLLAAERSKGRALLDILQLGGGTFAGPIPDEERAREASLDGAIRMLNADLRRARGRPVVDAETVTALEGRLQRARLDYDANQARLYSAYPALRTQRGRAPLLSASDLDPLVPDTSVAIVEYVVGRDAVQVFVATRRPSEDGQSRVAVEAHTLPIGRDALAVRVAALRDRIAARDLAIKTEARAFFDLVFAPIYDHLVGCTTVIVVPDDALWDVPFQALVSPSGRYLVEDVAFAYAPSLTVLRDTRRLASEHPARSRRTLLALGNPVVGVVADADGRRTMSAEGAFTPLPEAGRQVERLRTIYGRASSVHVGAAAREERVKRDANGYSVLHLATHGVLDDANPLYSYVVLAPDPGVAGDDGVLEAREILNLRLGADLVVLSACESARGRFGRGEGVIGMSWALFVAGVPASVVSQWKVDAASTTDLMVAFHARWQASSRRRSTNDAKATALQDASRAVMADARYRHPFYWAGFIVMGDAR